MKNSFDVQKDFPIKNSFNKIHKLNISLIKLEYSFSLKYNITEVKYQYIFYDNNILIIPSNLTLLYDLHSFCFMKDKNDIINIISLANIYENKYFYCIEYFNINEKVNFGIKIFKKHSFEQFYFFSYNKFDYNDISHKKDNIFSPLIISKKYNLKRKKSYI